MINFYLPNFYEREFNIVNTYFIKKIRNNPEYFYNNIQIGAVYGTFPGVIWNGGRFMRGEAKLKDVFSTIEYFRKLNIPIRFTYTNPLITKEHLDNKYANNITRLANNGYNEILVNIPELEEYLRDKYPKYKFLSSTTKCLLDNEKIIKESENYYLTVLDYRKNDDFEFLENLPNPERYEILINAYCDPKCPNRQGHYEELGKCQIEDIPTKFKCNTSRDSFFEALNDFNTVIKVEDLYSKYVDMGFKHFKIEGRTNHIIDVIESYLYYMVKPEYKDKIRYEVLKIL